MKNGAGLQQSFQLLPNTQRHTEAAAERETVPQSSPLMPHAADGLWLALQCPALPLMALGLASTSSPPLAVSIVRGRKACLLAVDDKAQQLGVRCGMSVTSATTLCPDLQVRRHDPHLEAIALQGLATWAGGYTSRISVQPPRGLLLEIGGSVRLFKGLCALLRTIGDDLQRLGYRVTRAVAPTPMAAWLLASAGYAAPVSSVQHLRRALSNVPVHCLQLPQRSLDDLDALGVRTFGECLRLPRDGLTRRFGPGLLNAMDRALGVRADPRTRWTPAAHFERRLDLAFESADRAVLMRGVELLLSELVGFLDSHGCGAGALELQLAHQGAPATRINLELVVPSRDAEHLQALLAQRIERAPIHHQVLYLGMRVKRLLALAPHTGDLYSPRQKSGQGDVSGQHGQLLVERLGARLGLERVRTLTPVSDYRPERSGLELSWHTQQGHSGIKSRRSETALTFDSGMPLWLLPLPRPLDGAGVSDGRLVLEEGPCRIESGWLDGDDVARDYYVARSTRGSRYWIFRECRKPRGWYIHGLFA